jgi:hypothetical protein
MGDRYEKLQTLIENEQRAVAACVRPAESLMDSAYDAFTFGNEVRREVEVTDMSTAMAYEHLIVELLHAARKAIDVADGAASPLGATGARALTTEKQCSYQAAAMQARMRARVYSVVLREILPEAERVRKAVPTGREGIVRDDASRAVIHLFIPGYTKE